jgi:hypothetical protein
MNDIEHLHSTENNWGRRMKKKKKKKKRRRREKKKVCGSIMYIYIVCIKYNYNNIIVYNNPIEI